MTERGRPVVVSFFCCFFTEIMQFEWKCIYKFVYITEIKKDTFKLFTNRCDMIIICIYI